MHLNIQLFRPGLILSDSNNPGFRVSALLSFVKQIPKMALWHPAHSDQGSFTFLYLVNRCFTAGIVFWKCHLTRNTRKLPSSRLWSKEYDQPHDICCYSFPTSRVPIYSSSYVRSSRARRVAGESCSTRGACCLGHVLIYTRKSSRISRSNDKHQATRHPLDDRYLVGIMPSWFLCVPVIDE